MVDMSSEKPFILYGAVGSGGAVAVEAALTLIGLDYQVVDAAPWGDEDQRTRAARYNRLGEVPTLILPGGEIMTESAAILLWLGDRYPHAALAPRPEDRRRVAYLRWMAFIPANIYPMYTVRDHPERWVEDPDAQTQLLRATRQRLIDAWRVMEAEVDPAPHVLGHALSVLDLYVATMSRGTPRRTVFRQTCPKLAAAAERVDADPRLRPLFDQRFPFDPGWDQEG